MKNTYDLLEGVLAEIEKGLTDEVSEKSLARQFAVSQVHLRRLFKFAFGRTIGAYIRSRKLAASIDTLLHTDANVLDIALDCGLEHERSYIRAFKREYGITPGGLRKTGQIVKITPPLQLFDTNRMKDGVFFGPDIVIMPKFHVVGRKHKMPYRDQLSLTPAVAKDFFYNERFKIPNAVNPDVFINVSREPETNADYSWFMPSVQVKSLDYVPEGFDCDTIPSALCANFRFIGPGGAEMNMAAADAMYRTITEFMDDDSQKYFLERKKITIDKFDSSSYDGFFSQYELFTPVIEKSKINLIKKPDGITKTCIQELPAMRFIGKKYADSKDPAVYDRILASLDNCQLERFFDRIENQSNVKPEEIYDGGNSYVSLIFEKEGKIEYRLGMFMPKGTAAPDGCEAIDFPKSTAAICTVYGKRNSIIHYSDACRKKLAEEGITVKNGEKWFFQRFNWRRFYDEDIFSKRLLEYGYFLS